MSGRQKALRLVLGFLFAPLTPLLLLLAISLGSGSIEVRESILMIVLGLPSVYAPGIVLGIPGFLVLRWRRWDSMMAYFAAGAVIGLVLCLISITVAEVRYADPSIIGRQARGLWPFLIACSLASSSVFWMIVRPDTFDTPPAKVPDASLPPAP